MSRLWSRLTGPQRATLLLIAALVTAVGILLALFERVEETDEIGLSGEARINDFLAVERMLVAMGVTADSTWGIKALPTDGALLLLDDDPDFRARIAPEVLSWVADGGVALVATTTIGPHPILEAAGFTVPDPWRATEETDNGETDTGETVDAPEEAAPEEAAPPESRRYGQGRITMLRDPGQYSNERLIDDDAPGRALWEALTIDGVPGRATLVIRGTPPSLLGALWRAGWPAVISALVLLLAVCLRAARRLGPLLPDPTTDRRSILEHIEATGVFLWRQGHAGILLDSARRAAGLPETGEALTDPRQFTAEIERLQQEWKRADRHRDH
jgi:hypothetical protein